MDTEARRAQFIRDALSVDRDYVTPSWSFLFHNNYLRRVLKALFEARKDLSYRKVEAKLGIDKKNLHSYLNFDLNQNSNQKLSDFNIVKLAKELGVDIDITILVHENIKIDGNEE
jgi:hypothetical protein